MKLLPTLLLSREIFSSRFTLEKNLGVIKDTYVASKLVTSGPYSLSYNLRFMNQLIDSREIVPEVSHRVTGCNGTELVETVSKINVDLQKSFKEIFMDLGTEYQKSRENRGVPAVVLAGAVPVVAHAATKVVDWIFDRSKAKKENQFRKELEKEQKLLKQRIIESTVELCAIREDARHQRLIKIGQELLKNLKTDIRAQLGKLISGILPNEHKVRACLAVNKKLSSFDCVRLVKFTDVEFEIEEIAYLMENEGLVRLTVRIPLVLEVLKGNKIFSVGVPRTVNGQNWLMRPLVPDFLSLENVAYKFHGPQNFHIRIQDLERNAIFDPDCVARESTGRDGSCDVVGTRIYSDFIIEEIQGMNFLVNFVPCSQIGCDSKTLATNFEPGIHEISLQRTILQCDSVRLDLCHEPVVETEKVSHSNYSAYLNIKQPRANSLEQPIWDVDNSLENIHVGPGLSLRVCLIIIMSTTLLTIIIGGIFFYKRFKRFTRPKITAF